jgi:two-component system, NtrC family, response regulator
MATILIIDDSPSALSLIREMLEQQGHAVLVASDGAGGLETVQQHVVHLVITDIYMPGKDGLEFISELRSLQPDLPVIAMSSHPGPVNVLRVAALAGACGMLRKPFSRHALDEAVTAALSRRKLRARPGVPNAAPAPADADPGMSAPRPRSPEASAKNPQD